MLRKISHVLLALVVLAIVAAAVLYLRADTETLVLDDAVRAAAPGRFVELTDGWTHYDIAGPESAQAVVLVHGFSVPYYIWDTTFDALVEAGFRAVRFDLFGRGYSDRPDATYDGALFERQVTELVEALALRGPVDVIGLSMGGAVTMRVVANHPRMVRKVVLVDPAYQGYAPPSYPEPIGKFVLALTVIPGMAEGQLGDFLRPDDYPTWVDQYKVQMQYEGFRQAIISTIYHYRTEDHLASYRVAATQGVPVKLIWGVEDRTLDIAGAETIRAVLDVDFMPVDDAGHLPHIEQADLVNPAIVQFLKLGSNRN